MNEIEEIEEELEHIVAKVDRVALMTLLVVDALLGLA